MQIKNKKETYVCIGFVLAILIMRLWNISQLDAPFLFGDEAGYWSHAANLAGLSWTEVESLWYSYGYSLILLPLFGITHHMPYLYRMAILLNACMGVISFLLGKRIVLEADENCKDITAACISFTAVSYSSYIFQSNIAWSETFLYTWFLLAVLGMIKVCKAPSGKSVLLCTAEIAFLYLIHNRCIVVLAAYILTLLYMTKEHAIGRKTLAAVLLLLVILFFADHLIREQLSIWMWNTTDGFSGNDMGSQGKRLSLLLSFEGWKTLLYSFAGKMWYLLSSTLMLAYLGMAYMIHKIFRYAKKRKEGISDIGFFFYIFLFLSVGSVIALSSVVMTAGEISDTGLTRLDIYFYGRYSDCVSGILIIFGLLHLLNSVRNKWILQWFAGLAVYLLCGYFLYRQIGSIDSFYINTPCAPGIYFFEEFSVIKITLLTLFIYLAGNIPGIIASGTRKIKVGGTVCFCIAAVIIFSDVSIHTYQCYTQVHQNASLKTGQLCEILNGSSDYTIYNLVRKKTFQQRIRTKVTENKIRYEYPSKSEDNYFLIMELEQMGRFSGELYFITAVENICLFVTGDALAETIREKGYACERLKYKQCQPLGMNDAIVELVNKTALVETSRKDRLSLDVMVRSNKNGTIMYNCSNYKLSYHIYDKNGSLLYKDGKRYKIDSFVNHTVVPVLIDTSEFGGTGTYILEFDIVEEGKAWLSDLGGKTARQYVAIVDDSVRYQYDIGTDDFIKTGFHDVEDGQFSWTCSEQAQVRCYLDIGDYQVRLQQAVGIPLKELNMHTYPIEVFMNGDYLTTMKVDESNNAGDLEFWIPKENVKQGANIITFKSKLWSPADYGQMDERKLGFTYRKMIFEKRRKEQ